MSADRREFLTRLATSTAVLGGLSLALPLSSAGAAFADADDSILGTGHAQGDWNTSWPDRLTGRVRTVFDVPEIESGYGVWRASIWANQYEATLKIPRAQLSTALVIRHNAIVLAMQQEYWDKYGVGADNSIPHPVTGEPTRRNPALLGEADGVGAPFSEFALGPFMARGGVVLACDLALRDVIATIARVDGSAPDAARTRALALMVPGVIRQPSGVFSVLLAQQTKQALYIRAS
jgi:hypothetical protein